MEICEKIWKILEGETERTKDLAIFELHLRNEEDYKNLIRTAVDKRKKRIKKWESKQTELKNNVKELDSKIGILREKEWFIGRYWRKLQERKRKKKEDKIKSLESDIKNLWSELKNSEKIAKNCLKEKVEDYRWGILMVELEEILNIKLGRTKGYNFGVRDLDLDYFHNIHDRELLEDGWALCVINYSDRIGKTRRLFQEGYLLDLDKRMVCAEFPAGSPEWIGGRYLSSEIIEQDENGISFKIHSQEFPYYQGYHYDKKAGKLKKNNEI